MMELEEKVSELQKTQRVMERDMERKRQRKMIDGESSGDEGNMVIRKNINLVNLGEKKRQCEQCAERDSKKTADI